MQHDIAWEDRDANLARLAGMVDAVAGDGAEVVVLAEMFATGFSMDADRVAEGPEGPSTGFLVDAAARNHAWVCGSIALRTDPDGPASNVLTVAGPAGELVRYAKVHPFTYSGEHEHYRAGDALVTVPIGTLRCTLFVCYDLRFADEFWASAHHTDCYLVVANWPAARREHWTTLLRARAIENQAWVVGVNRVGAGGGQDYAGDSCIIDPWGTPVATAGAGEEVIAADVDPAAVADARARFPVLADRRPHWAP